MNELFDDKFFYRLRFFILGILIGTVLLWVIYSKNNRKRVYKWPSEIVLENISNGRWQIDTNAICILKKLKLDTLQIKSALKNAKVNFSASKVNQEPCKIYQTELDLNSKVYKLNFYYCRDSSVLIKDIILDDETVTCPG